MCLGNNSLLDGKVKENANIDSKCYCTQLIYYFINKKLPDLQTEFMGKTHPDELVKAKVSSHGTAEAQQLSTSNLLIS